MKPSTTASRSPRRTAEQTRLKIMTSALELFADRGYLGTSISDIAALSGVGKANILYFFSNKDTLWKQSVEHLFGTVAEFLGSDQFLKVEPDWDVFEDFFRRYMIACARYPAYIKIPMIEGGHASWRTAWLADHYLRRDMAWMRRFLRPFVDAGMVPPDREFELQALLGGGGQIIFGQEPLFSRALRGKSLDEDFAVDYARFVVSFLRRHHP